MKNVKLDPSVVIHDLLTSVMTRTTIMPDRKRMAVAMRCLRRTVTFFFSRAVCRSKGGGGFR